LRKDFIFDPYQIFEARAAGADSFLLIAALLDRNALKSFISLGRDLGMEPLVEVHDAVELENVLESDAKIIGINNRNLKTFHVDLGISLELVSRVPSGHTVISESGIRTRGDIDLLAKAGVNGFLIGETLVLSADPAEKLRELRHG
jgi:indole-3-glycerol phosphate synthase